MFLPIFLILVGSFWLLKNLGFLPAQTGDYFWPLVMIALGISILIKKKKWWEFYCGSWFKKKKENTD